MTNPKIVLVNGPPRSGKDTAQTYIDNSVRLKFAEPLKEGAHRLFGLDLKSYPMDAFENNKDEPSDLFFGRTPREVYISCSENLMKPATGDEGIFGHILSRKIKLIHSFEENVNPLYVITDSGFRQEAEVIVDNFGSENILLIRLHREGFDYKKDSRGYIELSDLGVETIDIKNNNIYQFKNDIVRAVDGWRYA